MNWWSETALVWLPGDLDAYPERFPDRARPGSSDFFYYALDAFDAVEKQRPDKPGLMPWAYVLEDHRILSPRDIDALMPEWREQTATIRRTAPTTATVRASEPGSETAANPAEDVGPNSWKHDGSAPPKPDNAVKGGPTP